MFKVQNPAYKDFERQTFHFVQNFVRKSHSTYGSFNTLNGSDDRNHGSADAISTLRDDETEFIDAEMLNDIKTMDNVENIDQEANDAEIQDSAVAMEETAIENNEAMEENQDGK